MKHPGLRFTRWSDNDSRLHIGGPEVALRGRRIGRLPCVGEARFLQNDRFSGLFRQLNSLLASPRGGFCGTEFLAIEDGMNVRCEKIAELPHDLLLIAHQWFTRTDWYR